MIYKYQGQAAEDILLAGLWFKMVENGDLEKVWGREIPLSTFFEMIGKCNRFFYKLNKEETAIIFCWWFDQMIEAETMAIWLDPKERTMHGWIDSRKVIDAALEVTESLLVATSQERLLDIYRRLGYKILAEVPGMYPNGVKGYLALLTREAWKEATSRHKKEEAMGEQLTFEDFTGDSRWAS